MNIQSFILLALIILLCGRIIYKSIEKSKKGVCSGCSLNSKCSKNCSCCK